MLRRAELYGVLEELVPFTSINAVEIALCEVNKLEIEFSSSFYVIHRFLTFIVDEKHLKWIAKGQ